MKQKINGKTHIFNLRLFLEGLKRLRVIGLATGILAVTTSALIPIVYWIECVKGDRNDFYITEAGSAYGRSVQSGMLCIPACLMMFLAPFFFLTLFSFLHKRKDSDFFHAIPYTRTCVYQSFVASALTFIGAIQLLCGIISATLWGLCPYVSVNSGSIAGTVAVSFLAAAMLSAFMMLALTVSGTPGSCMILFVLFTVFVRVVVGIYLGMLDTTPIIDIDYLWDHFPLSFNRFLPFEVLVFCMGGGKGAVCPVGDIIYTVAVTSILFVVAGFLYARRKSEMAGNPASGKRTQSLFRIMIAMPTALLMVCALRIEGDIAVFLIFFVITALIYFIYELITTKRPKNLLHIFPGFGIVLGIAAVFLLTEYTHHIVVTNERIRKEDIQSLSIAHYGVFESNSHQFYEAAEERIDDPALIAMVADFYRASQDDAEIHSSFTKGSTYEVVLYLNNGRRLYRRIAVPVSQKYDETQGVHGLRNMLQSLPHYQKIRYTFPDFETKDMEDFVITYIVGNSVQSSENYASLSMKDHNFAEELLSVYAEEYAALNEEQKDRSWHLMKTGSHTMLKTYGGFCIRIAGMIPEMMADAHYYTNDYYIDELTPRSMALVLSVLEKETHCEVSKVPLGTGKIYGGAEAVLGYMEGSDWIEQTGSTYVDITGILPIARTYFHDDSVYLTKENTARLVRLLQEKKIDGDDPDKISINEETAYVTCCIYDERKGIQEAVFSGVFAFNENDLKALRTILGNNGFGKYRDVSEMGQTTDPLVYEMPDKGDMPIDPPKTEATSD